MESHSVDPQNKSGSDESGISECGLTKMSQGDEIVISGASCRLPESDNMEEFWDHLIQSHDMVTEDDRRWKPGLYSLPKRNGKIKDPSQFDAKFFHINTFQAKAMDPQLRLLLEVTYEAIVDAGYNPAELRGTHTSVYVGTMVTEAFEASGNMKDEKKLGYGFTGANGSMFPNHVSYYFDFKGPSVSVNASCSSSLTALDMAVKSILSGQCQYAIAAGTNLVLKPGTSLHMMKFGVLSPEGTCKSFDASVDGYVRSEGIVAVLVTRRRFSRRSYAKILNSRCSCDGHKEQGVTYPSGAAQKELILTTHGEVGVLPDDVYYVEAHGTGTVAGDYEECRALDEAIGDREYRGMDGKIMKRTTPLFVGSVKSNMGHSEPTSGLASIVKIVMSFQRGVIPPNIHFDVPNPRITGITENRLSVVTSPTPITPDAIVGLNSFGIGGANTHMVLRGSGEDLKDDASLEMEKVVMSFPVSSRTKKGLDGLMDFVETHRSNKEVLTLLSSSMTNTAVNMYPYRGYVLWDDTQTTVNRIMTKVDSSAMKSQPPPVWFVFAGMGSQWSKMGRDLLQYPIFADSIKRCYDALPSSVHNLITSTNEDVTYSSVDEVVAICATSLSLCNLLKAVGLEPDHLVGHSLGELILSYSDGGLTLEQCVQVAYWRARGNAEADLPDGAMAAVSLSWDKVEPRCPEDVWIACHNAPENVTITGRKEAVEKIVAELEKEKVVTRMVKCSGIPYHSPLMKAAIHEKTLSKLRSIIGTPKPKSSKWVVTALSDDKEAHDLCSAEFHMQSLRSQVHFYKALKRIPQNAVVIEIAPHGLLQRLLKQSLHPDTLITPLQDRRKGDQAVVFMDALGKCYNAGLSVNPLALLKPVSFPVSLHTPSIGHLVSWDHTQEWFVPKPDDFFSHSSSSSKSVVTKMIKMDPENLTMFENVDLTGYRIGGSITIPPSVYLYMVWKTLAEVKETTLSHLPIAFKDVIFTKLVTIGETDAPQSFTILISPLSGHFEVSTNEEELLVIGNVSTETKYIGTKSPTEISGSLCKSGDTAVLGLKGEDIYKEMSIKGYQIGGDFKALSHSTNPCLSVCKTHSVSGDSAPMVMLDTQFQMCLLHKSEAEDIKDSHVNVLVPSDLEYLEIDPTSMLLNENGESTILYYDKDSDVCFTEDCSLYLSGLRFSSKPRKAMDCEPCIEYYTFHPYFVPPGKKTRSGDGLKTMIEIVVENASKSELKVLHVLEMDKMEDNLKGVEEMSELVEMYFRSEIHHDLLMVGSLNSTSTNSTILPKVTGSTYSVDSLTPPQLSTISLKYDLIITSSQKTSVLSSDTLLGKLTPGGFILVKETLSTYQETMTEDLEMGVSIALKKLDFSRVAQCYSTDTGKVADDNMATKSLLLLYHHTPVDQVKSKTEDQVAFVHIQSSDKSLSWFSKLKSLLTKKDGPKRVYCISECDPANPSGLLGMVNCLRLEGYKDHLRCVFLMDTNWEEFQTKLTSVWHEILAKDLLMNVVKDDKHGSLRHFSLKSSPEKGLYMKSSLSLQPHFECRSDTAYIITGGLGGFGLELASWLVKRGAKCLILTSRSGVKSGYQERKLALMRSKGVIVEVSNLDVSVESQALSLMRLALKKKWLCAVFHLAAVLNDHLFENQTEESFKMVLGSKFNGAVNLDKAIRCLSIQHPDLKSSLFVTFSSVASAWGNAGQSNYAFANSCLERLCEQRVRDGMHGLAIQWGLIGDVGLFSEAVTHKVIKKVVVAHTRPQPIGSCLSSLDVLLNCGCPVVSCCVPDLKVDEGDEMMSDTGLSLIPDGGDGMEIEMKSTICHILGIKSHEIDFETPLSDIGLDSLTRSLLQNLLEDKYNITIPAKELPMLTIADIIEKAGHSSKKTLDIKSTICDVLGIKSHELDFVTPLSDVGLDSLTRSMLQNALDEKYGITVSAKELSVMSVEMLMERVGGSGVKISVSVSSVDSGIGTTSESVVQVINA